MIAWNHRVSDVGKVIVAYAIALGCVLVDEEVSVLAAIWVPVGAWGTLQIPRPDAERHVWPRSAAGWGALLALSASVLSWTKYQLLSGTSIYVASATAGAALGAMSAGLWNRRQRGAQDPRVGVLTAGALTAMWVWAALPALNALGSPQIRHEAGTIVRVEPHRTDFRSTRRRYVSSHSGNSVVIKLRDRSLELDLDTATFATIRDVRCVELAIATGLLGVEYSRARWLVPAAEQNIKCLETAASSRAPAGVSN